ARCAHVATRGRPPHHCDERSDEAIHRRPIAHARSRLRCTTRPQRPLIMCGINGILRLSTSSPAIAREEVLRTREHQARRGPDGAGLWESADRRIALAHNRLAIIDLSPAGAQPMSFANGRYRITFNGEIYNYRELRQSLRAQGVRFLTDSDTEVVMALYARDGVRMLPLLRGMYAFALWDDIEKTLLLARDPFGIKPLYYATDGGMLRFASQVEALMAGGALSSE